MSACEVMPRSDVTCRPQARWVLKRRSVYVVPRRDGTGYVIRVRWSERLGLQLDHVFTHEARALQVCRQIELRGSIDLAYWKKIFFPKWSPTCRTLH